MILVLHPINSTERQQKIAIFYPTHADGLLHKWKNILANTLIRLFTFIRN